MKFNAGFAVFVDVIEFKPFMGENIDKYKEKFEQWYYEDTITNGFPIRKQRSDLPFKYFDGNVIVYWLNEIAPNCGAKIVQLHISPEEEDKSLPGMYF